MMIKKFNTVYHCIIRIECSYASFVLSKLPRAPYLDERTLTYERVFFMKYTLKLTKKHHFIRKLKTRKKTKIKQ